MVIDHGRNRSTNNENRRKCLQWFKSSFGVLLTIVRYCFTIVTLIWIANRSQTHYRHFRLFFFFLLTLFKYLEWIFRFGIHCSCGDYLVTISIKIDNKTPSIMLNNCHWYQYHIALLLWLSLSIQSQNQKIRYKVGPCKSNWSLLLLLLLWLLVVLLFVCSPFEHLISRNQWIRLHSDGDNWRNSIVCVLLSPVRFQLLIMSLADLISNCGEFAFIQCHMLK